MFKALLFKEWKEKAPIAAFGLGLMIAVLAAFLALADKRDLSDVIAAGFVLLVFPFIGLLLGAGAFESEFRDGAWAFLLSRPVRKETVWLAKLVAALAYLAGLWGAFLVMARSFPALGAFLKDFSLPAGFQVETSFLPLAIVSSLFYFSIAFAFSILSERQFSLLFAALFTGVILQALLINVVFALAANLSFEALRRPSWLSADKTGLILTALAFLGASLLAFRRADFSQPRKKAARLVRNAAPFVALAWVLALGGPLVLPGGGDRYLSVLSVAGDTAYFATGKGIYRYDVSRDRLRRLTGSRSWYPVGPPLPSGQFLGLDRGESELFTVDENGARRTRLAGGKGGPAALAEAHIQGGLISPDGKTVVFVAERPPAGGGSSVRRHFSMWSVGIDGAGLRELPLDPILAETSAASSWIWPVAWPSRSRAILLNRSEISGESRSLKLWAYDPATGSARALFESAWLQPSHVSPRGDFAAIAHRNAPGDPARLALLDLETLDWADVLELPPGHVLRMSWNPAGDVLAILLGGESGTVRLSLFSAAERRVTASRELARIAVEPPPLLSVGWIGGTGRLFWCDPKSGRLEILAPDLGRAKTIALPPSLTPALPRLYGGEAIFAADIREPSLWRLDLETEKWKKIWR